MKNKRFLRRFLTLLAVMLCMAATSTVAFAGGGDGEPYYTGEETTGRGAFASASRLKPDVCVAVDVTYATDYKDPGEAGDVSLGKGGVICRGSVPNAKLNEILEESAKELNLPVQFEVFAGRTGTDADTMLKTGDGIPQTLFSIPLRYMHSPVEVLSVKDVDSMIDVLALFLTKLNGDISLLPYSLD